MAAHPQGAGVPFSEFRLPADFNEQHQQGEWGGIGGGPKPTITLMNEALWQQFNQHTNEMIIAKKGRCLFPVPRLTIANLEPEVLYTVAVDFVPVDSVRWKYVDGRWMEGGKGEKHVLASVHVHPDSPHSGAFWMKKEIAFDTVKVTNKFNNEGHIVLNTFHKYRLRFHIIKINEPLQEPTIIKTESFPATDFIAVTSYVNEHIKFLKINNNPFARAFKMDKEASAGAAQAGGPGHDNTDSNDEGEDSEHEGGGAPPAPHGPSQAAAPGSNKRKAAALGPMSTLSEIEEAAAAAPDVREKLPSLDMDRPLKVLVVDSDTAVHGLVTSQLGGRGFNVKCVADSARAWDLLSQTMDDAAAQEGDNGDPDRRPYDIVLTEIAGEGLDGLALMRRIRGPPTLACTAVTLMSVDNHPAAADTCVSEGADDYMTKPLSIDLFARRGRTCVEKRRWKARERWITTALRDETKRLAELERVREMLNVQSETKARKVDELNEEVTRMRMRISGTSATAR
eukprot:Opistho-1_new@85281